MEEPPPWLSPERTACAAAVAPWLRVWLRRMFDAQAGAVPGAEDDDFGVSPPTVPIEEVPRPAAKAA
jgi:hypothetical protein